MAPDDNPLGIMVRKLSHQAVLNDEDRRALLTLPCIMRDVPASAYVVREGERPHHCAVLVSGYAFRQKLTREGSRQILSLHLPGDLLDLQHLFLDVADHNVQTLTRARLAYVSRASVLELMKARPAVAFALGVSSMVDSSVFREWILNVGRRDARARVAHVLCEFGARLDALGLAEGEGYELPMTQEQLGDALGLTAVHVNRTLKNLEEDGLITRNRRFISFPRGGALPQVGDFNPRYLHLDQQHPATGAD